MSDDNPTSQREFRVRWTTETTAENTQEALLNSITILLQQLRGETLAPVTFEIQDLQSLDTTTGTMAFTV